MSEAFSTPSPVLLSTNALTMCGFDQTLQDLKVVVHHGLDLPFLSEGAVEVASVVPVGPKEASWRKDSAVSRFRFSTSPRSVF